MVLSLVGNKTDLVNQRKVLREEAHQYAVSIGGTYFETSALQDEGEPLVQLHNVSNRTFLTKGIAKLINVFLIDRY